MLKVFYIYVYALLDPGTTLSFVTPVIAKKHDILPDILNEPFMVSTPMGESVVSKGGSETNNSRLHVRLVPIRYLLVKL